MHLLFVDDDQYFVAQFRDFLEAQFPSCIVEHAICLSDAVASFPRWREQPPDIIIMDVMIPQETPTSGPALRNVDIDMVFDGGIKLFCLLREVEMFRRIPVIFLSACSKERIEQHVPSDDLSVTILTKPVPADDIVRAIRTYTMHLPSAQPRRQSFFQRLVDATDAKVGGFGVEIDMKKLTKGKSL